MKLALEIKSLILSLTIESLIVSLSLSISLIFTLILGVLTLFLYPKKLIVTPLLIRLKPFECSVKPIPLIKEEYLCLLWKQSFINSIKSSHVSSLCTSAYLSSNLSICSCIADIISAISLET